MAEINDSMFGDAILPEKRLEAHQATLAGVRHAFDAQPPRPRPGQDIGLTVTTGGPA